jgi:hypothetical protein
MARRTRFKRAPASGVIPDGLDSPACTSFLRGKLLDHRAAFVVQDLLWWSSGPDGYRDKTTMPCC